MKDKLDLSLGESLYLEGFSDHYQVEDPDPKKNPFFLEF